MAIAPSTTRRSVERNDRHRSSVRRRLLCLVAGVPARVVRPLGEKDLLRIRRKTRIRPSRQVAEVEIRLKRVDLPPERVPTHRDIHQAQTTLTRYLIEDLLGNENGAGTRAPHGHSRIVVLANRLVESVGLHQLADGGRFAAGNRQDVAFRKIGWAPHFKNFGGGVVTLPLERTEECIDMFADIALQRKYADPNVHGSAAPHRP